MFVQIEVQSRWFTDKNFQELYSRYFSRALNAEKVQQSYTKTMVFVRKIAHTEARQVALSLVFVQDEAASIDSNSISVKAHVQ